MKPFVSSPSRGALALVALVLVAGCKRGPLELSIEKKEYDTASKTLTLTMHGPKNTKIAARTGKSWDADSLEAFETDAEGSAKLEIKNDSTEREASAPVIWTFYETTKEKLAKAKSDSAVSKLTRRVTLTIPLPLPLSMDLGALRGFGVTMRYIDSTGVIFMSDGPTDGDVTIGDGPKRPLSGKSFPVEPMAVLGGKSPAALFGGGTVAPVCLPTTLEEGKKTWAGEYCFQPDQQRAATARIFKAVRSGPVKVPAEGTGNATLWLVSPDVAPVAKLIGTAKTFGDIGYVAIQTSLRVSKSCGSYRSSSGNTTSVLLNMYRETVVVYERRTGKKVASKELVPSSVCPTMTSARAGSATTTSGSFVPEKEVRDFIVASTPP